MAYFRNFMNCSCFGAKKASATVCSEPEKPSPPAKDDEFNDTRIQLTRKQKFLLIKNWKGIEREVTTTGIEMFLKYVLKEY